ncbi:CD48 antigen-like [Oryzias latipes]|uniref:Ig-like domain-containing protein n=1 Tax=Oryzias latipes TaxID=8090 RepID=A0A3B3I4K7_ORYLA|nr:CD48 antigen-like [Oryzias latipes]
MASTPFFFLSILFLAWFTTDALSVKVIEVLKGSSIVLSPGEAETSIISITWKHGDDLAADWFGGDTTFYRIYKDRCSLNTKTGELTINNVRPEHGGEYTPDINGKTRSTVKLRVFSPVPKPNIIHDCNPEETKCTLLCTFVRTDDLGDVEVFWILDDRRENGTELQITKDTKEKRFYCSLKNPVSSENSTELKNPLFSGGTSLYYLLMFLVIPLIGVGLFLIFHHEKRPTVERTLKQRFLRWLFKDDDL